MICMKQTHAPGLNLARTAAPIIWVCAGVFLFRHRTQLTPQAIQHISPENQLVLILFLLLLYAGKTLSLVFPLKVPQLAAGLLLPAPFAAAVNLLGTGVSAAVGYGMGRLLGGDSVRRITGKNPRLAALLNEQNGDVLFFSFFLRSLVFLPLDAVSLYFGASKADFRSYLAGSLLGMLPNIILSTLMGAALTDPKSPAFLLSTAGFLLLSAGSALWYAKRRKRREET